METNEEELLTQFVMGWDLKRDVPTVVAMKKRTSSPSWRTASIFCDTFEYKGKREALEWMNVDLRRDWYVTQRRHAVEEFVTNLVKDDTFSCTFLRGDASCPPLHRARRVLSHMESKLV